MFCKFYRDLQGDLTDTLTNGNITTCNTWLWACYNTICFIFIFIKHLYCSGAKKNYLIFIYKYKMVKLQNIHLYTLAVVPHVTSLSHSTTKNLLVIGY